ncbi:hypothetical protein Dimus_005736 [Dionaea muscipula]
MSKEGKKPKRHLKKKFGEVGGKTETGPTLKKAKKAKLLRAKSQREEFTLSAFGESTDRERMKPVGSKTEQKEEAVETVKDDSLLSTVELNKEVDDLIFGAIQYSFISDTTISLDTLVQDQREDDLSGLLYIPVGSDRGMSQLLGQNKGNEEAIVQKEGKGVMVADDEQRKDEMEEIDGNEGM